MIEKIFDTNNWKAAKIGWLPNESNSDDIYDIHSWRNTLKALSPLDLYKFLKAKFGPPNGFTMFLKKESTDNLIHWHYTILSDENVINFLGNSSGIEINLRLLKNIPFSSEKWEILISNIKSSFSKYGKEMNEVQSGLEKWSLFINPYTRLYDTLVDLTRQLKKLDLTEVEMFQPSTDEKTKDVYFENLNNWINNVDKAAVLGTTIRMLSPVLAEAFINLLILTFSKIEFKKDKRLYESLIRQQIDIRVKTLHLNCNGFVKQIDSDKNEFKNFQTMMNGRNDFLHGNVDPQRLTFEDVYFDQTFIPLFKNDEGIIRKMLKNYLTHVEPDKALADFKIVTDFINFVLEHLGEKESKLIQMLMISRTPGINSKTNRLGILFSPGLAETFM